MARHCDTANRISAIPEKARMNSGNMFSSHTVCGARLIGPMARWYRCGGTFGHLSYPISHCKQVPYSYPAGKASLNGSLGEQVTSQPWSTECALTDAPSGPKLNHWPFNAKTKL